MTIIYVYKDIYIYIYIYIFVFLEKNNVIKVCLSPLLQSPPGTTEPLHFQKHILKSFILFETLHDVRNEAYCIHNRRSHMCK